MGEQLLQLGVFASGRGTNLQSIISACEEKRIPARVAVVISDRANAEALVRASKHHIPIASLLPQAYGSKEAWETALVEKLQEYEVELICLAGFMRVLGNTLLKAYPHQVINIHPALLPAFPGLKAQQQALQHGVKVTGCTVHFVDEEVDHGPIVLQAAVEVKEGDTVESLSERILKEEHRLYPEAIRLIAEKRIRLEGRTVRIQGGGS